jgi:large subunit ribosomal protein L25
MAEVKLSALSRTEFGKGAARRTRRAGLVPAVLYGHGADPVHISLPGHDTLLALRAANALLAISIDGDRPQLALPKQVQRNPIKGDIEHVDLVIVKRGEKVTVEVPLVISGEPASGTLLTQDLSTITIEADALNIPDQIELSIAGVTAGTQIHASDLTLPEGATLAGDADALVVAVNEAPSAAQLEGDEAAPAEATEES